MKHSRIDKKASNQATGKPLKHESAEKQVSGEAPFVDDYMTDTECLHAAIVTSSITRGKILSADFSQIENQPGVTHIFQYKDIPGLKDIGTLYQGDPLLCDGEIRFHSQPVALILAHTHKQAWEAAQYAQIHYTKMPAVADYSHAIQSPALLPESHLGSQFDDSETDSCELNLEGELSTGGQEHFYLEGQISLAEPVEDGGMFIRCSGQNPTETQSMAAKVLGIPFNKVTVETRRMGGGFGGKETNATQWACLAALAAHLSGKMVKIRLPRTIDMMTTGKRHPFISHYKLGCTKNGIIQHAKLELNALCGHSPDLSQAIVDRALFHCDNAYFLNHVSVTGRHLKTDTVSNTAFRGFGAPQGAMLIEKVMQDMSIQTQMDSLDVRLNNLYRKNADRTHYGMQVEQYDTLKDVIQKLEVSSEYRKRRQTINHWNKQSPVIKKGLALTPVKFGISFTVSFLNQAGALLHIYTDGSVQISHGGTEMGQGLYTKIRQITAQALGISIDKILVTSTRTDKVPNTSATAASSGSDLNGMAAYNAAVTIRKRLLEFAVSHYNLNEKPVIYNDELISGETKTPWEELIEQAYLNRVSLSATGYYKTPKIGYDREKGCGRPFFYFSIGAACSEVAIDTLTGEMKVTRVDILHDAGNSLNPAIDKGQIEGAFIQGMGWLTTEELVWDERGKLLTNSPMSYKIPTVGDYPQQMNICLYDKSNPEHTIYRSKAIGEPPFLLAISVWCAIYDAVSSISDHTIPAKINAPATPEEVLKACLDQQNHKGTTEKEKE